MIIQSNLMPTIAKLNLILPIIYFDTHEHLVLSDEIPLKQYCTTLGGDIY